MKSYHLLVALIGITVAFSACKKDEVSTPAIAALSVVNASPNSNALDFYLDQNMVNNSNLLFGEKIEYQQAFQGVRNATVTAAGTHTSLLTKSIVLQGGRYHSLYIVGNLESLDYVFLKDDLTPPATSMAKIRFINLSPDAPSLSLEIQGDTATFTDRAFKAFTPFKQVTAAKTTLVLKNNETNAVLATLSDVDLQSKKIYTVWAKGLVNTMVDDQKLTVKVTIQND